MPLQFDSSPYLQVWQAQRQRDQEEAQRPQVANQNILQALQMLAESKRQQQLMDMQKQQADQQGMESRLKFGFQGYEPQSTQPLIQQNPMFGRQSMTGTGKLDFKQEFSNYAQRQKENPMVGKVRSQFGLPQGYVPGTEHMKAYGDLQKTMSPADAITPEIAQAMGLPSALIGKPREYASLYLTNQNRNEQNQLKNEQFTLKNQQEELKKQQADQLAAKALRGQEDNANLVVQKVDQALAKVSGWNTGGMSGSKDVPFLGQMTGATNLDADLQTIKALLGFDKLAEMKAGSKAGASGLGALSENEMTLLTSAVANLEQSQDDTQLAERLNEVKLRAKNWLLMEKGVNPYGSGGQQQGGLMWQGRPLKDTPANRAWLQQQQGGGQ